MPLYKGISKVGNFSDFSVFRVFQSSRLWFLLSYETAFYVALVAPTPHYQIVTGSLLAPDKTWEMENEELTTFNSNPVKICNSLEMHKYTLRNV